jgi:eukaryotic-like serine/threonine-protein kinase
MSLLAGARLGPYEVLAPLGAGGMGEVYRARDTRLGRDVAIKVLPDDVANDPKALARFESEARAVAALSHPNILALFDVGEANGIHYTVTELLEGETLRVALRQGAFPIRRALEVSQQIAEGLAAAHEKGIVHRDVKPENVFITKDGRAKLLDFGLARHNAISSDPGFTNSPTADALTERGAVLGTVVYMSPEQASGRPIEHRSDQFSLGIVLYEMLAGTRPFQGNTVAETLTAIIREEPEPLEKAASGVPAPLRWIVERLLAKESGGRYDSTRDLARDLAALRLHISESTSSGLSGTEVAAPTVSRHAALTRTAATVGIVALAVGAGVLLDRWALPGRRAAGLPNATFQRLTTFDGIETWPTLSPDGKTVAYQKSVGGKSDVYVLRVGGQNPTNLTASLDGDCGEPAFSPDGRFIAFRSESGGGGIFLMEATGESAKRLTDFGHTPAWFPDGKRVALATEVQEDPGFSLTDSQLWIVDVGSGVRRKLQVAGRAYQPSVSPHGLRIAYWGVHRGQRDIHTVGTGDEGAGSPTAVTGDMALNWSPFWSGDGRFLYFASGRGGTMNLWRVGIDEASGKVHGEPEPVTVPVSWAGPFRATPDGSRIVFTSVERERTLERLPFDPTTEKVSGAPVPLARMGTRTGWLRVSPQGDLLTLGELGSKVDILVLKTDGTGVRKLTDDNYQNLLSSFSPDGRKIVFYSNRMGTFDAWVVDVDGSGLTPVTRSTSGSNVTVPIWSPDGKTIAANCSGRLVLIPCPRSAEDPLPEPAPLSGEGLKFLPYSWSPDSKLLSGVILRADGSYNGIVVYEVEKKSYRRVTETGWNPSFLRDGRRIAFLGGNVLKIVDTATGRISEILKGDPRRTIDAFGLSPDDRSLFVSWASAQADLWLMDLGGSK